MKNILVAITVLALCGCGNLEGVAGRARSTRGVLDETFGTAGKAIYNLSYSGETARAMALQSDGKIVIAGNEGIAISVVRLTSAGAIDTTFDSDGKNTVSFATVLENVALAIQSDGKIVVAGDIFTSPKTLVLARFNADGSLDTTFDSDGKVTTAVGTIDATAGSLAIQSDGKILLGAYVNSAGTAYDLTVLRYNSDGSLDTTFDGDGRATYDGGFGDWEYLKKVLIRPDGKIVATGMNTNNEFIAMQLNTDGTLDTSFGTSGFSANTVSSYAYAYSSTVAGGAALQSDGKILIAGTAYNINDISDDQFVLRINLNGSLDTGFGSSGRVQYVASGTNSWDSLYYFYVESFTDVAVQSDGKIVVSGIVDNGSDIDFSVITLEANGSFDANFGRYFNGKSEFSVDVGNDVAQAIALQPDGKILVAGGCNRNSNENTPQYDYAVIRVTP
jgi:uncharacterized delta-60 repeat protein